MTTDITLCSPPASQGQHIWPHYAVAAAAAGAAAAGRGKVPN